MSEVDPRVSAAEAVLRELGVDGRVEVRGHEGEMACLRLAERDRATLAGERGERIAERVRALGFRFVALDLAPDADAG